MKPSYKAATGGRSTCAIVTFQLPSQHPVPRTAAERRGIAVLVVLLLLSVTLGLSYAIVRSQATTLVIQKNTQRQFSARQAAVTGLMVAIKKMHQSTWAGVDVPITGALSTYESYNVTCTTGDSSLTSSRADYSEWPYRVTLVSTGSAVDPENPTSVATYRVQAVVRLVLRKLTDEPTSWADMLEHTVYQWTTGTFQVDVPSRVEGALRIQNTLSLGTEYQWDVFHWNANARYQYLTDLNAMRAAGGPDYRPVTGPVNLPTGGQPHTVSVLGTMGVAVNNRDASMVSSWTHPGQVSTYRIYPGGKLYSATSLASQLRDVSLGPDPKTNPLGIFYRAGSLTLYDNVSIRGTVVTQNSSSGDINIYGKNVSLVPFDLPALEGSTTPIRLPVALVGDRVSVNAGASSSITGLLALWNALEVASDDQHDITMTILGRVITKSFIIHGRAEWEWYWRDWFWWDDQYNQFTAQSTHAGGIKYFPTWVNNGFALDPVPLLQVRPDPTPATYHYWKTPSDPIYVKDPSDAGLRWDLLQWTEGL